MGFEKIVVPKKVMYRNVTCDGCGEALKQVDGVDSEDWDFLQPDDALILYLDGGYGMFIDSIHASEEELTKILCCECAKKFWELFPKIGESLKKHLSASVGHKCSKYRKFVWRTISECCVSYCSKCGRDGTMIVGREIDGDFYSHEIVNCITGCKYIGPGIWGWEVNKFVWNVCEWNDDKEIEVVIKRFDTMDEAHNYIEQNYSDEMIMSRDVFTVKGVVVGETNGN